MNRDTAHRRVWAGKWWQPLGPLTNKSLFILCTEIMRQRSSVKKKKMKTIAREDKQKQKHGGSLGEPQSFTCLLSFSGRIFISVCAAIDYLVKLEPKLAFSLFHLHLTPVYTGSHSGSPQTSAVHRPPRSQVAASHCL